MITLSRTNHHLDRHLVRWVLSLFVVGSLILSVASRARAASDTTTDFRRSFDIRWDDRIRPANLPSASSIVSAACYALALSHTGNDQPRGSANQFDRLLDRAILVR